MAGEILLAIAYLGAGCAVLWIIWFVAGIMWIRFGPVPKADRAPKPRSAFEKRVIAVIAYRPDNR